MNCDSGPDAGDLNSCSLGEHTPVHLPVRGLLWHSLLFISRLSYLLIGIPLSIVVVCSGWAFLLHSLAWDTMAAGCHYFLSPLVCTLLPECGLPSTAGAHSVCLLDVTLLRCGQLQRLSWPCLLAPSLGVLHLCWLQLPWLVIPSCTVVGSVVQVVVRGYVCSNCVGSYGSRFTFWLLFAAVSAASYIIRT